MKRNLKKLFCFVLTVIMVMGITTTAFASEVDSGSGTPAVEDTSSTYIGETFYYNADTGEAVAENGEPFAFDDVEIELPISSTEDGISHLVMVQVENLYLNHLQIIQKVLRQQDRPI